MKNLSQKEIVFNQLQNEGEVTRNWCLDRRITRLASIKNILVSEGIEIEDGFTRGGDFVYKLKVKETLF